jgi:alanine racemase
MPALAGAIRQVVTPEAQILQRRRVPAGEPIGYNATFSAAADIEVAVINLGYADGYLRCFEKSGVGRAAGQALPLLGRISMDLIAVGVDAAPALREGDWIALDYALPQTAAASGLSQYELLTGLGRRFDRIWRG